MIYEMTTYNLKTRVLGEVEKRLGDAYAKRKLYSELAASWHTEIGPLNQVVLMWPYKDLEERAAVDAAVQKDGVWPPDIGEFVVSMQSDIMAPLPFSPPIKPGNMGPYFEMRTYTYALGELPTMMKIWGKAIETRMEFGPVCVICYATTGALNKFVHVWPYQSLDQRMDIRARARATGKWPPALRAKNEGERVDVLLATENKLLMPSWFSPIQ